jgi:hypothetical protein
MDLMTSKYSGDNPVRCWLTYERTNWLALIVLAAGIGFAAGQSNTNAKWVAKEAAVEVAPVKAQEKCEHRRADLATLAATRADVDPSIIPNCPPEKH